MDFFHIQKRPFTFLWHILALILAYGPNLITCLLKESAYPKNLLECLDIYSKNVKVTEVTAHSIQSQCLNMFLARTVDSQFQPLNLTQEQKNYFAYLHRTGMSEMIAMRKKRQDNRRVRRELRVLSQTERQDLFDAINLLKNDTSIAPNVYDSFANLHQGEALDAGHDGPNFLGWHRYYLYLYENALRTKRPNVALAYWDSTLDFNMNDPITTIIFSSIFVGNVAIDGSVISGPFQDWGDFWRNVGRVGSPMSDELLEPIFFDNSVNRHEQVVVGGNRRDRTIEGQHDNVHGWVGGSMAGLRTSPRDPIFYFHHCFIDYVWQVFREKLISLGVDPETDYPDVGGPGHGPNEPMIGFPWINNIDGYSNNLTDFVYRYEAKPECPRCGDSPYLRCIRGRCVSDSTTAVNEVPMAAMAAGMDMLEPQAPVIVGRQFKVSFNDTRVIGNPRPAIVAHDPQLSEFLVAESIAAAAAAEMAGTQELQANGFLGNFPAQNQADRSFNTLSQPNFLFRKRRSATSNPDMNLHFPSIAIFKTVPNSFSLNGVSDVSKWAFMSVRVVHMRPEIKLDNATVTESLDVLSWNPSKNLKSSGLAVYPKSYPLPSGAAKIFIETNGLTYQGKHIGYSIIDERQPIIESKVYVAFQNPKDGKGKFIVTAYDSYGRVCRTLCQVPGSFPAVYRSCSGVIQSSSAFPRMYSDTHADAIRQQWDFEFSGCPRQQNDVFLTVLCDYQAKWPWTIV